MSYRLKAGTRPSKLAFRQVLEVNQLIPEVEFNIVSIATKGDRDKLTPLESVEGSNFFTYEIEQALLRKEIDLAIHSAKDLEENTPEGLTIAALTKSISEFDCLVSRNNLSLGQLPVNSIIGTSSRNRKEAIIKYRKDLVVKDIRGNIQERLNQLHKGCFDAIIVAHAALIRLGYESLITQIIPFDIIRPHPLQGRLAVQVNRERNDLIDILRRIDE